MWFMSKHVTNNVSLFNSQENVDTSNLKDTDEHSKPVIIISIIIHHRETKSALNVPSDRKNKSESECSHA